MSDETLNDPTNVSVALSTLAPGVTAGEVPQWTGTTWTNDLLSDYPLNVISNTTNALTIKATSGGNTVLGVDAKNALVDIKGDLTVYGNATFTSVDNIAVENSLISLATTNPADVLDIGIYGKYVNGVGTLTHYSALFRDASDSGKWKFATTDTEPNLTVSSFTAADLEIGALTTTGATVSGLTASRLLATNSSKGLASVSSLASWILGNASEVSVTDMLNGTIQLGTPQQIATTSSVQFLRGYFGAGVVPGDVVLQATDALANATNIRLKNTSTGGHSWLIGTQGSTYTSNLLGSLNLYDETAVASRLNVSATGNVFVGDALGFPAAAVNKVDISGALAVGASAAGVTTAPTNGIYSQGDVRIAALTASRLTATDADKDLASVATLSSWIAGTSNQVTVTDDGDGSITLALPQSIATASSPTFTGLTLSGLTATRLTATNGSKALASVATLSSWIAGTSNQVTVTDDGDGSITLALPQSIATNSTVRFGAMGIGETTPDVALHIASSNTNATDIRLKNTSTGGHSWVFSSLGSAYAGDLKGSWNFYDETAVGTRMNLSASGTVMIGNATSLGAAVNKLDVAGALAVGAAAAAVTTAPTNGIYSQGDVRIAALTASRLTATDADKDLASVATLSSWIAGTSNQITVTDDGDGSITLTLPQSIATTSDVTFQTAQLTKAAGGNCVRWSDNTLTGLLGVSSGQSAVYFASESAHDLGFATANGAVQFRLRTGGELFLANAGVVPSTNPVAGGYLYSEGGAGKWRGSSGTITTFGPADPHCPVCDADFGLEWENEKYGGVFQVCVKCLCKELGDRPWIRMHSRR